MYSGREVLTAINSGLVQITHQVDNSEQEIDQLNSQQLKLEKSESEQFRKLAKLRLNLLASGDIIQRLDASERRAEELLKQRLQTRRDLKQQIAHLDKERSKLEQQRDVQAELADKATEALDQREAETQKTLAADEKYQQQLLQAQNADRTAIHAEEKTDVSTKDRIEKGKPYEQDVFFMYLWKRNYGTSKYHANNLIRYFDKKIAHLCGYDKARANYNMLTELPVRLQSHAEIKRQRADEALQALKKLEQDAAALAGVAALQTHLHTAEQALEDAEQAIEDHDAKTLTLQHREAAFVTGEDKEFLDIIQLLVSTFRRDDLTALYQDAAQTPLPEDDLIVRELLSIRNQRDELTDTQSQQRELLKEQQQRQLGLNSVQRAFKQSRYDASNSVFSDGTRVSLLLNQYLNGILDSTVLWKQLQRLQKTQAAYSDPFFGTGSFPRSGGDVWRGGRSRFPRGGSGGFSFPRRGGLGGLGGGGLGGSGGGGGGFRTGGGF